MSVAALPAVSLHAALSYWLKLGFVSFGGPAGQISLMHSDLVDRLRWISERRFLHALNYVMVLPGPEAQQLATYIGWLMHGTWGGIVAGVLFVAPSLVVFCALSWIYLVFGDAPAVAGVLYGIKPAVTAIVIFAAYRIGSRTVRTAPLMAVAIGAFVATVLFAVPFPVIVVAAALIGFAGGRWAPQFFRSGGSKHAATAIAAGPAVLDDDTPTPAHARFRVGSIVLFAVLGLLLWAALQGALIVSFGLSSDLALMGWFFTKAALLTFGGAYAVLPYVYQGGVETYGWVTAPQMIDGLALGETTPGPLIMVVAFVGFVGAWTKELLGPDQLLAAGVVRSDDRNGFHVPAVVLVRSGRRPLGRSHSPRRVARRAVDRHHGSGRRSDPEPCGFFRLARVLARGHARRAFLRAFRVAVVADRRCGVDGAVAI